MFSFFSNIDKHEETHVHSTATKKIYILERKKEEGNRKKEKTYPSKTKADLVDNIIRILVFFSVSSLNFSPHKIFSLLRTENVSK